MKAKKTYKTIKVEESTKEKFAGIVNTLKNNGFANTDTEALEYILGRFMKTPEETATQKIKHISSHTKAEIFISLIIAHNESENKKHKDNKAYEPNYIAPLTWNAIAQEISLNVTRLDKELKTRLHKRLTEQANKMRFDGSENLNPVISEKKEYKINTRIIKKRPFIQAILEKSRYSSLFGYDKQPTETNTNKKQNKNRKIEKTK